MIRLLKSRDSPKTQVKIIGLIKKWGEKFKNSKDLLPYFSNIYESLLANGVTFPEKYSSEYVKYLNLTNEDSSAKQSVRNSQSQSLYINDNENNKSLTPTKLILSNDNKKYHKFINEMNIVIDNIQLANQLMDSTKIGDEVDDCLRSIILNLKNCEPGLLKAIQVQIKDESLLSNCLLLNDDLNQTSERYDYIKSGQVPKNFKSAFGWITKSEDKANEDKAGFRKEENQKMNLSKMETIQKPSVDIFGLFDNMEITNNQKKNEVDDFNTKQIKAEYNNFDPFSSSSNNIQKNEKINVIDLIDNIGIGRSSVIEKKNEPVVFDLVGNSNSQQQRNSQNNKKNIDDILNSAFNSNSNYQFSSQLPVQIQSNLYPSVNITNNNQSNQSYQSNDKFNQNFNSLYGNNSQFQPNSSQIQINKEGGFKNSVFDYQSNNQGNDFNKKDKLDGLNPFS